MKTIRLELARTKEFPDGSAAHGYEFTVPLTEDGRIDEAAARKDPAVCLVHRFWGTDEDHTGQLVQTSDGAWAFSYEPGEADDEPIFRFTEHAFKQGEYVTITETDGVAYPFRVVWVRDWRPGD